MCCLIAYGFTGQEEYIEKQNERLPTETVIVKIKRNLVQPRVDTAEILRANPHALKAAPIKGLYEIYQNGALPSINELGVTAFNAYKRDTKTPLKKPGIALILTEFGNNNKQSEIALEVLPKEITFALEPYTRDIDDWRKKARLKGHELLIYMPAETKNYPQDDPGLHTMIIDAPKRENLIKYKAILKRTSGYIGVISPYESIFTQSISDFRPILTDMQSRGLAFIEKGPGQSPLVEALIESKAIPYARADRNIDRVENKNAIIAELNALEELAKENGHAVGVFRSLPVSYNTILEWQKDLSQRGIQLIPVSYVAEKNMIEAVKKANGTNTSRN